MRGAPLERKTILFEHTRHRINISHAEHYIRIIADHGINQKVPPEFWQQQVEALVEKIQAREFANGLQEMIQTCGEKLIEFFPLKEGEKKQDLLPNHIIIDRSEGEI